jgi:hypothetical protein
MKTFCCKATQRRYNQLLYCSNCLIPVKESSFFRRLFALISFIGIMLSYIAICDSTHKYPSRYTHEDIYLSKDSVIANMQRIGILFPEIVYQQIIFESGNFKSDIAKENKNILGIKYVKQEHAIGVNRGHAVYASYLDCLKDYKRIQEIYLRQLGKRYAEDSSYVKKISRGKYF